MDDTLRRMRELAPKLPLIPKLEEFKVVNDGGTIEYDVKNGTSFTRRILSRKEASGAIVFISNGSHFPHHIHEEKEVLIFIAGRVLYYEGKKDKRVLKVGDVVEVAPGTDHKMTAIEDTMLIAITIPHSEDLP